MKLSTAFTAVCISTTIFFGRISDAQANDQAELLFDCKLKNAVRVLFVGNSFTYYNSLPLTLAALVMDSKTQPPVTVAQVVWGGAHLQEHFKRGAARTSIAKDGPWTYVVLQEQSHTPIAVPDEFLAAVQQFDYDIKNVRAMTVLYETWADKATPEDQSSLTAAYTKAASQTRALLVPVGDAFAKCLREHSEINLYNPDGKHPSREGTYLAACVFYAKLFGRSPVGLPGALSLYDLDTKQNLRLFELPATTARTLQQIAFTVASSR